MNQYHVIRELGRGGVGVVYLAIQGIYSLVLKTVIAVTDVSSYLFKRECLFLSSVNHPSLPRYHGSDNATYLAMEYIEGKSLDKTTIEEMGNWGRFRFIFAQVIDALCYLHYKGIVHCDLKPHNIMVTPEGRAKVIDLGMACWIGENTLGGTPGYMDSVQMSNGPAHPSMDVYAFALMFCKLMRLPVIPVSGDEFISKAEGRGVPSELACAIYLALQEEPNVRPTSAQIYNLFI